MPKAGLIPFDPSADLRDHSSVLKAVVAALEEGDHQAAQEVLVGALRYMNRTRVVRRYGIPRRTLYNLLGFKSVPTLELVAKVCYALKREAAHARKNDVDTAAKSAKIPSRERKALPVGPHPRL